MCSELREIAGFFARPLGATFSSAGQASDWLYVGSLVIRSGILSIGDAMLFPDAQVEVEVEFGEYVVEAIAFDYGIDRRIARLRVALPNRVAAATAQSAGTISVDFAVVGVCDFPEFLGALNHACDAGKNIALYEENYLNQQANGDRPWSVIALPATMPTTMVTVSTGWGDGGYEVFRLDTDSSTIGIEVEFISPEERYPFG
jgi:hypothetical protein